MSDEQPPKKTYTFPHTQQLSVPYKLGQVEFDTLEYGPLTLGSVRKLNLSFGELGKSFDWTHVIQMAFAMTGVASAKLELLHGADANEMREIVMSAWGEFHGTGSVEPQS